MVNCQLPESVGGICESPDELPPPHAESIIVPVSRNSARLFIHAAQKRGASRLPLALHIPRDLVSVSMTLNVLEAELEPKLNRAWPVRIKWM